MAEPRDLVQLWEAKPSLPAGPGERLSGYGVMACPFSSGDILCHRRFSATSIGPAYTSIWHCDSDGRWTFYQDAPPARACTRFFGSAVASTVQTPIAAQWTGPRSFRLSMDNLEWELQLMPTPMTHTMTFIARSMPDALLRNPAVLKIMGAVAGPALQTGRLALSGRVPNRQRFIANPIHIWKISSARANLNGQDLGVACTTKQQTKLGDFWIPRSPLFVIGRSFFDTFDETRHLSATHA